MEKNFKLIPFDLSKAKTPSNPDGLDVVTRSGKDVRIICIDKIPLGYPIVALIGEESILEATHCCDEQGVTFDESECLCLKETIKKRLMTHKELSWWLRDCPEEHREYKYFDEDDEEEDEAPENRSVHHEYAYIESRADEPAKWVVIRSNGGEWHKPYITEEVTI